MSEESKKLNPFFSMWFKPSETVEEILKRKPGSLKRFFSILFGFTVSTLFFDTPPDMSSIFTTFILGTVMGYLLIITGSYIYKLIGKLLGGKATSAEIRTAMCWSCVPLIVPAALWIEGVIFLDRDLFPFLTPYVIETAFYVIGIIKIICLIWSCVLFITSFARVAKVSKFISAIIVFIPLIIPIFLALPDTLLYV